MPYLGRGLDKGNYLKLDDITSGFNGITTTFNLKAGGSAHYPGSGYSILVSLGGVIQEGESAYTINQDEITFAAAPSAVDDCFIVSLGVPLGVGVPGNSSVDGTKLSKPFNYDDYFYFDSTNNRVGIGSLTPQYDLDVVSTDTSATRIRSSSNTGVQDSLLLQSNGGTGIRFQPNFTPADKYNFRVAANTKVNNGLEITPSNNVGNTDFDHTVIGITTNQVGINSIEPTEALCVVGNLNVTGIVTATSGIVDSTLTATRLVYVDSDKSLTDDSKLFYDGTSLNVGASNTSFGAAAGIFRGSATAYDTGDTEPTLYVRNKNQSAATNFASIRIDTSGNGLGVVALNALNNSTSASADFSIQTRHSGSVAERLRITSDGSVGINSSAPKSKLDVKGNAIIGHRQVTGNPATTVGIATILGHHVNSNADYAQLYFQNSPSSGGGVNGSTASIRGGRETNNYGTSLSFWTNADTSVGNGTERLRILSNGRIGIGTDTAPRDMVHLHNPNANASSYVQFTNANTGGTGINDGTLIGISQNNSNTDGTGSGFTILQKENAEITLGTNNLERLRITSDGDIRQQWNDGNFLGSYYDSTYYMGFTFGATARTLYIDNRSNDTRADIVFRTKEGGAPEQRMRITSGGNVGIGTSVPGSLLHLCTDANANVSLKIEPGTTAGNYSEIVLGRTSSAPHRQTTPVVKGGVPTSGVAGILFGSENTNLPAIAFQTPNSANGHIIFKPKGSEHCRIKSTGEVGIGTADPQYKLHVHGSFAATTKSFVIPHPTKENYNLRYACLEGPENSVYVRGRITEPVIELPDYWTGLVNEESITVNLTPIGNKKVWVEGINNNKVSIGSNDSIDCFYTVFAERTDVEKLEVEVEVN